MTDDEVFDAMADRRRRQLLVSLVHDDPQPVPKLSTTSRELLQAHEGTIEAYLADTYEVADADRSAIRTHHTHLPKLVEYGFVEWDREAHLVAKGVEFDDLLPLLELVDDDWDERTPKEAILIVRE